MPAWQPAVAVLQKALLKLSCGTSACAEPSQKLVLSDKTLHLHFLNLPNTGSHQQMHQHRPSHAFILIHLLCTALSGIRLSSVVGLGTHHWHGG